MLAAAEAQMHVLHQSKRASGGCRQAGAGRQAGRPRSAAEVLMCSVSQGCSRQAALVGRRSETLVRFLRYRHRTSLPLGPDMHRLSLSDPAGLHAALHAQHQPPAAAHLCCVLVPPRIPNRRASHRMDLQGGRWVGAAEVRRRAMRGADPALDPALFAQPEIT